MIAASAHSTVTAARGRQRALMVGTATSPE
jgi:hypothetical protein